MLCDPREVCPRIFARSPPPHPPASNRRRPPSWTHLANLDLIGSSRSESEASNFQYYLLLMKPSRLLLGYCLPQTLFQKKILSHFSFPIAYRFWLLRQFAQKSYLDPLKSEQNLCSAHTHAQILPHSEV